MKKSNFLSLGLILAIILVSVLNIILGFLNKNTLFIFAILLIAISIPLIGYQKNKSMIEKDVILSIIAFIIFYYLVTYIIGYFTGFTKSIYAHDFKTILYNIFPVIMLIISSEVLRYIINSKSSNKMYLIFLSFLAFTLMLNTLTISDLVHAHLSDTSSVIEQLGLFIIPSIMTNILMTYLSIKVGYKSAIVYRLIMELPLYVIPIFPNFGNYIESVIRITIPVLFFLWLYKKIEKSKVKKIVIIEKKRLISLFGINIILLCAILIYFISGLFRMQALVIATGSMAPSINVGDVVIVNKESFEDRKNIKEGTVVAYRRGNDIICHRIIKIMRSGDEVLYETKGDRNTSSDQILVNSEDVIGVVTHKIKYIGYPTVALNKLR